MQILSKEQTYSIPQELILRHPVGDAFTSVTSQSRIEKSKLLYPLATNLPEEQVATMVDAGADSYLKTAAEQETWRKREEIYNETIQASALEGKSPDQAIAELESLVANDTVLSKLIPPATIELMKQSDNPVARRAALGRSANVLLAAELIQDKFEKNNEQWIHTGWDFADAFLNGDFLDTASSEAVPDNLSARKDIAARFDVLLNSNMEPEALTVEINKLLDEAADQGFFTQDNKFFLQDMVALLTEGNQSTTASVQEAFTYATGPQVPPPPLMDAQGRQLSAATPPRPDRAGDTTLKVMRPALETMGTYADGLVDINQSPTFAATRDYVPPILQRPVAALGDLGGLALSGVGAGITGAAGLVSEVIPQDRTREGQMARDLIGASQFAIPELAGVSSTTRLAGAAAKAPTAAKPAATGVLPSLGMTGKGADLFLDASLFGDAARLISVARKSPKEVSDALLKGANSSHVTSPVIPQASQPGVTGAAIATKQVNTPTQTAGWNLGQITLQADADLELIRQAAGRGINDAQLPQLKAEYQTRMQNTLGRNGLNRVVDWNVDAPTFENIVGWRLEGTIQGTAFVRQSGAQVRANQIGGVVVPNPSGPGWLVRKEENIPVGEFWLKSNNADEILDETKIYSSTDVNDLGNGFWGWLGSMAAQTTKPLHGLLLQAEGARSVALNKWAADTLPLLREVGRKGVVAVNNVWRELRDGSLAARRSPLTQTEFETYFYQINGRLPSAKETEFHLELARRNDQDWWLSADENLKREVNKGFEIVLVENTEQAGVKRNAASLGQSQVYDMDQQKFVSADTLSPDKQVYQLSEPFQFARGYGKYVASNGPKTRALRHEDVMGYNVGGSRLSAPNQDNFFLKQKRDLHTVDGETVGGRPITFMTAKTEKEARTAVTQINNVLDEIHTALPPRNFTKDNYLTAMSGLVSNSSINAAIARNADWLPDVGNMQDLVDFFDRHGLDFRRKVDFAEDGKAIVDNNDLLADITFGQASRSAGSLKRGDVRKDDVLLGYGGRTRDLVPPVASVQRSWFSSVNRATEAAYVAKSINGLIRSAIENKVVDVSTLSAVRYMTLKQKVKNLKINTGTLAGRKLELERRKIVSRLERRRWISDAYEKARYAFANALWDKGFTKSSKAIDAFSPDPNTALRGFAFEVNMGLLNPDQLWVQGVGGVMNTIAIADRELGIRAAAAVLPTRLLLRNGHVPAITHASKFVAKVLGITPQQYLDIVMELRQSGRAMVETSVVELAGEANAASVAFERLKSGSRFFYHEGERASTIAAHIAASLEELKRGTISLSDPIVRNRIVRRSDEMRNHMTGASKQAWEQLPMFQFMTYTFRIAEALTAGNFGGKAVLSPAKKVKLLTTQIALYGAGGVPVAGYYLDWFNYKYGTDVPEPAYDAFRKGALDFLVEQMTGLETEIGRRLAWGEGLYQMFENLKDNSLLATLMGPSYTSVKNPVDAMARFWYNTQNGYTNAPVQALLEAARTVKSVNMSYNAYTAFRYGEYLTRNNLLVTNDLSAKEAVAIAMGIPLEEINSTWRTLDFTKVDKKYYQEQGKNITNLYNLLSMELRRNGYTEEAKNLFQTIEATYAIYPAWERVEIERYVDKSVVPLQEQLMIDLMRTQNAAGRQQP